MQTNPASLDFVAVSKVKDATYMVNFPWQTVLLQGHCMKMLSSLPSCLAVDDIVTVTENVTKRGKKEKKKKSKAWLWVKVGALKHRSKVCECLRYWSFRVDALASMKNRLQSCRRTTEHSSQHYIAAITGARVLRYAPKTTGANAGIKAPKI